VQPPPDQQNPEKLAPRWHTAVLVALIVAVALTGMLLTGGTSATPETAGGANRLTDRLVGVYLPVFVVDWALVVYVSRIGRGENALGRLLGRVPRTVGQIAGTVALALAGVLLIEIAEMLAAMWSGGGHGGGALVTMGVVERLVWVAFAFTAGFCEEVVYRGYLQVQLGGFTRSVGVGIVLSALLFGVAHLDQGYAAAVRFTGYAVGLGLLARGRQSLVPGIVCHVLLDAVSGFTR
jgi:membrane protease YdiL (CAAX protease family)